jgi:quercetin dioxygenase-like cupin family protein
MEATEHSETGTHRLPTEPLHLGLGATSVVQPTFTGEMSWYEGYVERHGVDGAEGRLVSMHTFTDSWDVWEMHPVGTEMVLVTAGEMVLHQEIDGETSQVTLGVGEYIVNPPGAWHTADVTDSATAVFITAGEGTQHRAR